MMADAVLGVRYKRSTTELQRAYTDAIAWIALGGIEPPASRLWVELYEGAAFFGIAVPWSGIPRMSWCSEHWCGCW
jgi:hypothetical protein